MEFSLLISDLRKSLPGADRLSGLAGDELISALREFLGDAATGSRLKVDGDAVTVTPAASSATRLEEAARLYQKAGSNGNYSEFIHLYSESGINGRLRIESGSLISQAR